MKKAKNGVFTIQLRYDGLFVSTPLEYVDGELRLISHINFDGMSLNDLVEIVKRLIPARYKRD